MLPNLFAEGIRNLPKLDTSLSDQVTGSFNDGTGIFELMMLNTPKEDVDAQNCNFPIVSTWRI